MVEVWAAAAGASITVAGIGITGLKQQNQQGRDSLVRLTVAVDNLSRQLDVLHTDIRSVNQEVFARLADLEASVARLEGHANRN
jgi:predicted  nucleic acid-binding Zn-ribbon protein|tara:strand:+ start:211 stop:462 length:252 start_codon:yes stop_codon:yes gene_type:complete